MIEEHVCNECFYESLSKSEVPCYECKHIYEHGTMAYLYAKDYFKPKEEKGCNKCKYEHDSAIDEPCVDCSKSTSHFEPKEKTDEIDMVNHPPHYVGHGIEPIDFIESHNLNFNLGNVIKYVSRSPHKGTELQDLEKAKFYLEREIKRHGMHRND